MSNLAILAGKLRSANRLSGKLVIALDATASRRDTWNATRQIMGSIFARLTALGDLQISIGYFRGFLGDVQFTEFTGEVSDLDAAMSGLDCQAGNTQIGKVLEHFVEVVGAERPSAFVFIGDDQQEQIEALVHKARTLSAFNVPTFWFLEHTNDTSVKDTLDFKTLASASGGVFAEFTESAADKLEELLVAAATFAIGGRKALENGGEAARLLLTQLGGK